MGSKGGPLWKQITFWLSDQRYVLRVYPWICDLIMVERGFIYLILFFSLGANAARGGGYLSVRDSCGEKKTIFLKNGFLDFMDKVW